MYKILPYSNFSLNECVVAGLKINGSPVILKNRDRNYKPKLFINHTVYNDVEIAYLKDELTDWSEGINQYGIGILNSALMVKHDEKAGKKSKKSKKKSLDGNKIRYILSNKDLDKALEATLKYAGGVNGHTLIADAERGYLIEQTSKDEPEVTEYDFSKLVIRTNHGITHSHRGYAKGSDGRKSSESRYKLAQKYLKDVDTVDGAVENLRKQQHSDYNLNPFRVAPNNQKLEKPPLFTSSQVALDLKNKILYVYYYPDAIETFDGVKNTINTSIEPQIKVVTQEIQSIE